jgi:outer membrane cobalamin receptor
VSNIHRKHPLSVAVSMALLAAAATSAMAAEQPPLFRPERGGASQADELQEVTVTGVRESQIRAIELKRLAPSIQDSISAESIGQLPDVTITDALQRITGVQINRDAGVGTSVDVRGCLKSAPC